VSGGGQGTEVRGGDCRKPVRGGGGAMGGEEHEVRTVANVICAGLEKEEKVGIR